MSDFCIKPTQLLNNAFYDYQRFIEKCNNQDNNNERTDSQFNNSSGGDSTEAQDKTVLFNGINSNNDINLAKYDYMKREQQQKMATDILEQEMKKNDQPQSNGARSATSSFAVENKSNETKETFESDVNGVRINIDIKMLIIIV